MSDLKFNPNEVVVKVTEDEHSLLNCVITREDDIYCSLCIELNVASEGTSIEESKGNLTDAVKGYIESAVEQNLTVYRPVPTEDNPLISNKNSVIETFKLETNVSLLEHA